jgi:glycine betaine transporter
VLVAGIALSLLLAGGIIAVQAATIVFALPFSVVLLLMVISLVVAVRQEWHDEDARERHLHKKLREWVSKEESAGAGAGRSQPAARLPPETQL